MLATWDEYVEPMIQLVSADGAFEQGVHRVEQVLMKLLGEQQRLGQLVDDDLLLRTHARILEMQTTAQLTLRKARELLLPLREEARRHNAVTRGAALALSAIRKKGLTPYRRPRCRCSPVHRAPFGTASQVEAYVYALARFEPKPAQFPRASGKRKGEQPRAPRSAREMIERCQQALPLPDLMAWLLNRNPRAPTSCSTGSRACPRQPLPAQSPGAPRVPDPRTPRQPQLLCAGGQCQ